MTGKLIFSKSDAAAVLEPLLNQFTELDYEAARSLRQVDVRQIELSGGTASLTIYRIEQVDGAVRVVAQLAVDQGRFLLIFRQGQCFAEGIEFHPSQPPRRLRTDELYEYS